MSVVWVRHLLLNREPRVSGKGDLLDTRHKLRGHFVDHCESGREGGKGEGGGGGGARSQASPDWRIR